MYYLLYSIIFIFYTTLSLGGTIDPNIPDKKYIEYGSKFDCVVKIGGKYTNGKEYGASAVVIHPNWILTAAHVVNDSDVCEIQIKDKKFCISKVIVYKDFNENKIGECDIAMGYCEDSFNLEFYPKLYTNNDEESKICSICGYGFTGNFNTGSVSYDGQRRAGSNIIEYITKEMLICSSTKSSTRTSLEMLISSGDSGGGLFIDGKLAGINSCVIASDGSANSDWDDETGHTRVSLYSDWIMRNINEKKK